MQTKFYASCADSCVRLCFPQVVGWIGDYLEYIKIHGLKSSLCFWYESPADKLGEYVTYERRDSVEY